ncbi:hypothetical protein Pla108_22520 [Botrimarina colliarenosi]|uniref:(Na+)-NQR maturation NqrM n=1 Tax=Botrimarina colliarenosi TaxID=2528001 RepID=A0A5C6AFX8_9BACT|nr:(Na+)-NQR maturation NqrM [Botrimarina colliarenosi]TWT98095.1 hypothetical protein Pla108_22520 [Botrimarina colliarenosi]
MTTFLITLAVFLVALGLMSVGVMLSGRRIKGSCGGLANFKDEKGNSVCEACTNPSPDCRGVGDARDASAPAGKA